MKDICLFSQWSIDGDHQIVRETLQNERGGVIYTRIASYLEGGTLTAAILVAFCAINGTGISSDSFGPIRLQYPPPPFSYKEQHLEMFIDKRIN